MTTTLKLRGGTAAQWTTANPILAAREPGVETDTKKSKVGDGVTAWNALPYTKVAWSDVDGKPAVIAAGADAAAARAAIGAAAAADLSGKQDALGYTPEDTAAKGQANGYASLDGAGRLPASQLPVSAMEYKGTWNASTNTPALADGSGSAGDVYRVSTAGTRNLGSGAIEFGVGDYAIYNGSVWEKADTTDAVSSVAGKTGDVTLSKSDVGLGSVDNTADAAKNVASAAKLTTARNINGIPFDGTSNIAIPDATADTTHAAASKTTPVDADELPLADSAASFGLKRLTWANLKAVIAAYYDNAVRTMTNKTLASPTITGTPTSDAFADSVRNNPGGAKILNRSNVETGPQSDKYNHIGCMVNDLSFAHLRTGFSTTATLNGVTKVDGTDYVSGNWFVPDGTYGTLPIATTTDVWVVEVTLPTDSAYNATYGNYWGVITDQAYRPKDVTIDLFYNGAWANNVYSVTNAQHGFHIFQYGANNANRVDKLRITMSNANVTANPLRLLSVFSVNYSSALMNVGYVSRGGGALYGINALPPSFVATGASADIDLQFQPKGTGMIRVRQSGAGVDARVGAYGTDTNVDLNLVGRGSGKVKANGVPVAQQVVTPPATATSTGIAGQIAYDSSYFYQCIGTNSWKRVALSTW